MSTDKRGGNNRYIGFRSIAEKSERIDLGLALLSVLILPGQCLTDEDIALWCGCKRQNITRIADVALRKVRNALFFRESNRAMLTEFRDSIPHARSTAMATSKQSHI